MTRRMLACAALFLLSTAICHASEADAAARAVQTFYSAFYAGRWGDAASAFHPETIKMLHGMFVHIAETTDDETELQEYLKSLGVDSIPALKRSGSAVVVRRMFQQMWSGFPDETKTWWKASRFKYVGAVKDGSDYHIVFRTVGSIDGHGINAVSVATARRFQGKWMMFSSTEIAGMAQKLGAQAR